MLSSTDPLAANTVPLAGATPKADGGLDAALSAITGGSIPEAPNSGTGAGPNAAGSTGSPPNPTPEQLIALLEVVNGMVMRATIGSFGLKLDAREMERFVRLDKSEKDALLILAPAACEYVPTVQQYMKPVMAGLFVGVYGIGMFAKIKQLQKLKRDSEPATIHGDFANGEPQRD